MKINYDAIKVSLKNYRWWIAIIWLLLLIPVWFLPMMIIQGIYLLATGISLTTKFILDMMAIVTSDYLSWAARWFRRSIQ